MKTYYDLLEVSVDASEEEINEAYKKIISCILDEFNEGKISVEEYNKISNECFKAVETLTNLELRKDYNKRIGIVDDNEPESLELSSTGATVGNGVSNGNGDDDKKSKRNWLKIAIVTGAVAGICAVAIWGGSKIYKQIKISNKDIKNPIGVTDIADQPNYNDANVDSNTGDKQDSELNNSIDSSANETLGDTADETLGDTVDETLGDSKVSESQDTQPVVNVKNYGDVNDDTLVSEKAAILLDELNNAGMTNLSTGLPYTEEEIETLIRYANGSYVPDTEEEATTLYTDLLNFMCAPINMDHTLIKVAYLGGEESFKGTCDEYLNNQKRPDIVTAFTFGDCYAAPYLNWLQEQFYNMRYAKTREEATNIFNQIFQSYADIMKGDGFTLNGVTYKEQHLLGLDKVGVSNVYIYYGFASGAFRTINTKDNFEVKNHLISANPEEQKDIASFDEVFAWINGACQNELIPVDENGLPLVTSSEEGKAFGELTQINTIYRAKQNYLDRNAKKLTK